jgi:hypothetical protein
VRFYPDALIIAGLGELQVTSSKRINCWRKGYQKGQPDIIVGNPNKKYVGFCIDFYKLYKPSPEMEKYQVIVGVAIGVGVGYLIYRVI